MAIFYPDFDTNLFRDLHTERGETVRWWRGQICPCNNEQHVSTINTQCPLCHGVGVVYEEQNPTAGFQANVRGVSEIDIINSGGQLKTGSVFISSMPDEMAVSTGDYVLLPSRQLRENQTFAASGQTTDKLRHYAVKEIVRVRDLNQIYSQGVDYKLVSPSDPTTDRCYIQWLAGGKSPATGEIVSIMYYRAPLYEIRTDVGISRRAVDGVLLPQRVTANLKNPDWRNQ